MSEEKEEKKGLFNYLTKNVSMPRFCWYAVFFILVAVGLKILTAEEFLFKISDKIELATAAHKEAEARAKIARESQKAAEAKWKASLEKEEKVNAELNKRIDELNDKLEGMKKELKTEKVSLPPKLTPEIIKKTFGSRDKKFEKTFSAAQMDLASIRKKWNLKKKDSK